MNKKIIVIGREFGSGGHELGERLAEELGVPFYDKELVTQTSEHLGLGETEISHVDETVLSNLSTAYFAF